MAKKIKFLPFYLANKEIQSEKIQNHFLFCILEHCSLFCHSREHCILITQSLVAFGVMLFVMMDRPKVDFRVFGSAYSGLKNEATFFKMILFVLEH